MTTLRSDADVLVLGSTLGGLVAATYLARAGLRVVLIEELAHRKRSPLLREPFLLPGLGPDGPVRRVLRELTLPLIDQREIHRDETSLQVILSGARVDVRPDPDELAEELAAYGLAGVAAARAWLEAVAESAEEFRRTLWQDATPQRASPVPPKRAGTLGHRLQNALAPRPDAPLRVHGALPAPPAGIGAFAAAQLTALSGLDPGEAAPAPALLLDGARGAADRMPHSGAPFLDMFRRRFRTLHGEIWSVDAFSLLSERAEIGIELARTRCLARAIVIAVPREPLRDFLERNGSAPRWLRPGRPVVSTPSRLFRAERKALPVGLGDRVIVADRPAAGIHWLSFNRDPTHEGVEWVVASGPGAAALPPEQALGELAPFCHEDIVGVDPGPTPLWDLDGGEVRFPTGQPAPGSRPRALVTLAGPELAPGLGVEGEILQARRLAIRLAQRLGS